jgi:hypothetical protein
MGTTKKSQKASKQRLLKIAIQFLYLFVGAAIQQLALNLR